MRDKRKKAFQNLNIHRKNRVILSLDGGGIRGILTLQLLKELENIAGIPCYELVDMVAGTSMGGNIAALIAYGYDASQIEEIYMKLIKKVFITSDWMTHGYLNPPAYTKKMFRKALKETVGDRTTLENVCSKTHTDLMLTAKDTKAGEETFFSCFEDGSKYTGTYKDILIRAAMEATMSAPIYFSPLERFLDGGVTTYSNPVLSAFLEAVEYGPKGKYDMDRLTVLSFGTGCRTLLTGPEQMPDPSPFNFHFWFKWLMTESNDDSSDLQNYLLRSRIFSKLDFRRFQISLNARSIKKIPDRDLSEFHEIEVDRLWELTDKDLSGIQLDNLKYIPVMKAIGDSMVEYIRKNQNPPFGHDLVGKNKKELLVTRLGNPKQIKTNMRNTSWPDNLES